MDVSHHIIEILALLGYIFLTISYGLHFLSRF